jgi:hypothetical protein
MEIPAEIVQKWQSVWKKICNMAYGDSSNISFVCVPLDEHEYREILKYKTEKYVNYDQIMLDHMWQKISSVKDENGNFPEAKVFPDLKEIYVPRVLFETMGVFQWFQHSFPNCTIMFWEDSM